MRRHNQRVSRTADLNCGMKHQVVTGMAEHRYRGTRDARLDQINGQVSASEAYIATLSTRVDRLKQRSMGYAPYNNQAGARRIPISVHVDAAQYARFYGTEERPADAYAGALIETVNRAGHRLSNRHAVAPLAD